MATLSSASTLADVWNAYDDNASYEEDDSVSKARTFITACRILLRRLPAQNTRSSTTLRFDLKRIQNELQQAQRFVALKSASKGSGVIHPSLENFRG